MNSRNTMNKAPLSITYFEKSVYLQVSCTENPSETQLRSVLLLLLLLLLLLFKHF